MLRQVYPYVWHICMSRCDENFESVIRDIKHFTTDFMQEFPKLFINRC